MKSIGARLIIQKVRTLQCPLKGRKIIPLTDDTYLIYRCETCGWASDPKYTSVSQVHGHYPQKSIDDIYEYIANLRAEYANT